MENKKREIKALIFDVGGVVVFYDHMIAAREMSKIIRVSPKKIFNILNGSKNKFTNSYELAKSPQIYWGIMARSLKINPKKIPLKKFEKLWNTIFWPNKELILLLKNLKKEYKIALISNIGRLHEKYLAKKYRFKSFADIRVYSYKAKSRKPNKKIYLITLKRMKINSKEAVFVDDRLENVSGAKKMGLHGIHFKSNNQVVREFKELGILPGL
ncbi:HAD-IA family hydrolase [Candidatus Pacearchaeota archaeon]|nr:HAD-IA family hydrolase [Candidatus Pacearchaeota archaeon]